MYFSIISLIYSQYLVDTLRGGFLAFFMNNDPGHAIETFLNE